MERRPSVEVTKNLNLSDFELKLMKTPFKNLTKEQKVEAFRVDDRIQAEMDRLKQEEKALEVVTPFYESPETMTQLPRSFY